MIKKRVRKMKYDRELMINDVIKKRIEGASSYTLVNYIMDNYKCSKKIAYDILLAVQEEIVRIQYDDIEKSLADALSRLENIYEKGSPKIKLEAQKEINKIKGLYQDKIDITSKGEALTEIKIIEVNKRDEN